MKLAKGAIQPISLNELRPSLLDLLREEARMFSTVKTSDKSLTALVDAYLSEFDSPACFSNFTGGAWTSVTPHSRDTFIAVVDDARVGY